MTPGRLLYLMYYAPLGAVRRSIREGGPLQQWRVARAHRAMQQAASQLAPQDVPPPPDDEPPVCFLTGKKYWHQTAFCAHSLEHAAGRTFHFQFFDDGSFDQTLIREANRLFPRASIHDAASLATSLDQHLPANRYPILRAHRLVYPHLKKLTDLHCGQNSPRLVLDSDMLFFRRPNALLDWLATPTCPLHMADVDDAYGYPQDVLSSLSTSTIPSRVNVGVLGLNSAQINWSRLESICATLLSLHGPSYYLEQALSALILSELPPATSLPVAQYLTWPNRDECVRPTAALHHYVADSTLTYYSLAWRHFAPTGN